MSWESSIVYYQIINTVVKEELGGLHSAKCVMYSFDFHEIQELQHRNEWDKLSNLMVKAANFLENAGADFIVVCTNTMHKLADTIQANTSIPLLHIADATAEEIKKHGIRKVGLLATRFTMEQDFYIGRLKEKFEIDALPPSQKEDRDTVHNIIYQELCKGIVRQESKEKYLEIINRLVNQGVEGIILGCTEISLLIKNVDCSVPVFDTTEIHARKAVDIAINGII
jgi:aspartate racemase